MAAPGVDRIPDFLAVAGPPWVARVPAAAARRAVRFRLGLWGETETGEARQGGPSAGRSVVVDAQHVASGPGCVAVRVLAAQVPPWPARLDTRAGRCMRSRRCRAPGQRRAAQG